MIYDEDAVCMPRHYSVKAMISEEEQHHRAAELILQNKACPNLD